MTAQPTPQLEPRVHLSLLIENHYAGDPEPVLTRRTATAALPPGGDHQDEEWVEDYIWPHTGTGRSEDAIYTVKVTNTTHPDVIPVGTEWELGG